MLVVLRCAAVEGRRRLPCLVSALATFVVAFLVSTGAGAACSADDLLLHRAVLSSRGVANPERLTDGVSTFEGDAPESKAASRMTGLRPFVEWDLGEPMQVVAATLQADNNDAYRVTGSLDGRHYEPLWQIGTVSDPGLRERTSRELDGTARFVRLEALSGDQVYAASELKIYCQLPEPWPPARVVRDNRVRSPGATWFGQIESWKVVFGLVSMPLLLYLLPRLRRRRAQQGLVSVLVLTSAITWANLGRLHGDGSPVHYWDMFHYFMGTKYFPELGYFELYRCAAAAEHEAGRGHELDRLPIRDLETNLVYPGEWSRTHEGRCRASFSRERWQEFRADLETFRKQFTEHTLPQAFADHGFNATPFNTAWLRLWTRRLTPTPATLSALSGLDAAALALVVAFLWWGFGAVPATAAAVLLAVGAPWSYGWVGGCLGRQTWLACAAAGFALLARGRPFGGAVALTLSGMLRLFPFVFVGAVGLWVLVRALQARRLCRDGRRYLAGFALAVALSTAISTAAVGFPAHRQFLHVFQRHSHSPAANDIGLSFLLGWDADDASADIRLTEPTESWIHDHLNRREERRPLWVLAVAVSLGVVVLAAWQGAPPAACAALAGLLLFSLLPMTSYDYSWLALLVALARFRPAVLPRLIAFALFTQALFLFGGVSTVLGQHYLITIACGILLVSIVPWRELLEGRAFGQSTPSG